MEITTDISYGIIPYIRTPEGLRFLVVHQYSSLRDDTYWVFPKGHAEEGESPEDAARRELFEETGIEVGALDTEHPFTIEYTIELPERRIEKKAVFFLGEAQTADLQLQAEEIKDAQWLHYKEARERLSYENAKQALDESVEYLQKIGIIKN